MHFYSLYQKESRSLLTCISHDRFRYTGRACAGINRIWSSLRLVVADSMNKSFPPEHVGIRSLIYARTPSFPPLHQRSDDKNTHDTCVIERCLILVTDICCTPNTLTTAIILYLFGRCWKRSGGRPAQTLETVCMCVKKDNKVSVNRRLCDAAHTASWLW